MVHELYAAGSTSAEASNARCLGGEVYTNSKNLENPSRLLRCIGNLGEERRHDRR
jgi:hypothetical protein